MRWWEARRLAYNIALIMSLVLGYLAFTVVVTHFEHIIADPIIDEETGEFIAYDMDLGGVAGLFHCAGGFMGLLMANACYFLGAAVEKRVAYRYVAVYRKWAWRMGVAFSCFMPFSISIIHLLLCMFYPEYYNTTPRYL